MEGWIKLHRKLEEWEWFNDSQTVHLFVYLLLKANHSEKKWRGVTVQKGQHVTSIDKLSSATGISKQSVRTILKRLESTHELTRESTSQFTIITICNWDSYQISDNEANTAINTQTNKRLTNDQQATNKRLTTNNNDNNKKNVKKEDTYRSFDHLCMSVPEYEKLIAEGYTKQQIDSTLDDIENYKANKKYKSLYLTANKWLKKEKANQQQYYEPTACMGLRPLPLEGN